MVLKSPGFSILQASLTSAAQCGAALIEVTQERPLTVYMSTRGILLKLFISLYTGTGLTEIKQAVTDNIELAIQVKLEVDNSILETKDWCV